MRLPLLLATALALATLALPGAAADDAGSGQYIAQYPNGPNGLFGTAFCPVDPNEGASYVVSPKAPQNRLIIGVFDAVFRHQEPAYMLCFYAEGDVVEESITSGRTDVTLHTAWDRVDVYALPMWDVGEPVPRLASVGFVVWASF